MRVLAVKQGAPPALQLAEAPDPAASPGEAVVRVLASTINAGERARLPTAPEGHVFGWDVVGVVESAPPGGSIRAGAPVVGLAGRGGGWAQRVAVRAADLAEIPAGVSVADAASLPVAGLTALRAVLMYPTLLGARVLVIGGGAVAGFAVQLACLAGATVHATVRSERSAQRLRSLGGITVSVGTEPLPRDFDLVVDTVGGAATPRAVAAARPFGRVVVVGNLGDEAPGLGSGDLLASGAVVQGYRLTVDAVERPVGPDLDRLLAWVADGRLRAPQAREVDWRSEESVAEALESTAYPLRTVLRIADE